MFSPAQCSFLLDHKAVNSLAQQSAQSTRRGGEMPDVLWRCTTRLPKPPLAHLGTPGHTWAHLGRTWAHLGRTWAHLGAHLGAAHVGRVAHVGIDCQDTERTESRGNEERQRSLEQSHAKLTGSARMRRSFMHGPRT